ncbi:Hpt domain-containing protein [Flavobacteriaceae bacterium XHP0103]|uniref:Hpt domain-containing protein n=1 Tax=Marixanthotalea marina TaxID=2844359 RepID=UPI002989E4C2|nr:Hpt domain-containing protein [Marixanthotalea marina]MBU3821269.1 Hpt domain-containing protein [Marixanthotalea marina]
MIEKPNLSYIHSLSGGDKTFEKKLITILKTEFPVEKKLYEKNIKSNNFIESAENVHKLKHKISILGLIKSYEIASEFENNLKESNISLKDDFDDIMQNITNYLNTL